MSTVLHVISGPDLRRMLQRVADGEDPEMVYMEMYVNAEEREFPDDDGA